MGYKRTGLIGTIFTMKEDFFKKEFGKTNIEVFIPTKERQQIINRIISEELELGIVKKESQTILIENISSRSFVNYLNEIHYLHYIHKSSQILHSLHTQTLHRPQLKQFCFHTDFSNNRSA